MVEAQEFELTEKIGDIENHKHLEHALVLFDGQIIWHYEGDTILEDMFPNGTEVGEEELASKSNENKGRDKGQAKARVEPKRRGPTKGANGVEKKIK